MSDSIIERIVYMSEAILIAVFTFVLFMHIIQPLLVNIHPMFSLPNQMSSGRYPDTPAGIAYFEITLPTYFLYRLKKKSIISALSRKVN